MKNNNFRIVLLVEVLAIVLLYACNSETQTDKEPTIVKSTDSPVVKKKEPTEAPLPTKRPPIINITDTLSVKRLVLCMKDSAATYDRISLKLGEIYGIKLAAVIKKNNLKVTGQPMAWYKARKAPYFFEAGIPVDKRPRKLPANAFIKEIGVDSVIVAHFYGGYDLLPQAYEALTDIIKDRKRTLKSKPYEIYVGDPMDKEGKLNDPYKVQTDVVFPWK